jgi:hypothetical protein
MAAGSQKALFSTADSIADWQSVEAFSYVNILHSTYGSLASTHGALDNLIIQILGRKL